MNLQTLCTWIKTAATYWSALVSFLSSESAAAGVAKATEWMPLGPERVGYALYLWCPLLSAVVIVLVLFVISSVKNLSMVRRRLWGLLSLLVCLVAMTLSPLLFFAAENSWKNGAANPDYVYWILEPGCWAVPFAFFSGVVAVVLLLIKDFLTGRGGIP